MSAFWRLCAIIGFVVGFESCQPAKPQVGWPAITRETKPWTRWWWHGSSVTKEGITAEMEAYQQAGLGGLEITPIYGVFGDEKNFVEYLSPQWMDLFLHTLREAERLDLGIDMATGTGWPFGGPWVTDQDACKNLNYKIYELKGGESLQEKVEFIQAPFLRAVGKQVYEVHQSFSTEEISAVGTAKEPLVRQEPKKLEISQLVQPVSANKNLQALALDQVIFERPLTLRVLMAYSDQGTRINLTEHVDKGGTLDWIAPEGNWKLYAVFEGWHGKMVERAGPGGEGNVIDHFSTQALQRYLHHFDSAFKGSDVRSLRAFFNDSYEVDDARGAADWTPNLFDEFKTRRGYDLREQLPALFGNDEDEKNQRVLSDYRETISELVLDNFTTPWKNWAHQQAALVRNQAHGAPSNILDLYATVDIPEIEGVEPLRIKMASSAGNVTGKKLVSSESATWLNEHFESSLADIKVALDRFMLNGVNHIFYHGTSYSPPGEPWPGRLFYAAVHLNPRNSLWKDFDALNLYVSRCQSFLQHTKPDNDVLLYFPFFDPLAERGPEMVAHFDGIGKQFDSTAFQRAADKMLTEGYAFDYISDKQIGNLEMQDSKIRTEGGNNYQTLVIPKGQYIPVRTLQKIIELAESGATVLFSEGLPTSVSGFANLSENKKSFDELLARLSGKKVNSTGVTEVTLGKGRVIIGDNASELLEYAAVRKESMVSQGIQFIRKKSRNNSSLYFLANNSTNSLKGWIPLQAQAASAVVYNPMTGLFGKAKFRIGANKNAEVYIELQPTESVVIELNDEDVDVSPFTYYEHEGEEMELNDAWKISFIAGGPTLPGEVQLDTLTLWTDLAGEEYRNFSGSATYTKHFARPSAKSLWWKLELGEVQESAEVFLNGQSLGTLLGPHYEVVIDDTMIKDSNTLEIVVSNLMANHIAALDRQHVFWRKFYNVNFPARKAENRVNGLFCAITWEAYESGLKGPVTLVALTPQ